MKLLALAALVSLMTSCNTQNKDSYSGIDNMTGDLAMVGSQEHPGKKLMENNCYACHNPKVSMENIIAPPMIAVKMHYLSEDTSKEEFVNDILAWAKNPSEEKSKMPGAIRKFKLMPYQFFEEETIREIADYIFTNEIEEPVWFKGHFNDKHGNRPKMKGKMGHGKGMGLNKNRAGNINDN